MVGLWQQQELHYNSITHRDELEQKWWLLYKKAEYEIIIVTLHRDINWKQMD